MERQYHTGLCKEEMEGVHYVLLAGSCGRTREIIRQNKENVIHRIPEEYDYERALTWAVMNDGATGMRYAAMTHGMGPASTEIFMAELLQVIDHPATLIRIGTAGTMQKDIKVGDVVIATGCVRAESTSFKYAQGTDDIYVPLATPRVVAALEVSAPAGCGHVGLKVTKDSLYWEIGAVPMSARVKGFNRIAAEGGVKASSMESSVIYTMAYRYAQQMIFPDGNADRAVDVGTAVAIVNSPAEEGEEALFDDDDKMRRHAVDNVVQTGMGALRALNAYNSSAADIKSFEFDLLHTHQILRREQNHQAQSGAYRCQIMNLEDELNRMHPMWSMRHAV